jgi:hypothetical protein
MTAQIAVAGGFKDADKPMQATDAPGGRTLFFAGG